MVDTVATGCKATLRQNRKVTRTDDVKSAQESMSAVSGGEVVPFAIANKPSSAPDNAMAVVIKSARRARPIAEYAN